MLASFVQYLRMVESAKTTRHGPPTLVANLLTPIA
jgi:hypothetical protein